jgi:hypothetical protein
MIKKLKTLKNKFISLYLNFEKQADAKLEILVENNIKPFFIHWLNKISNQILIKRSIQMYKNIDEKYEEFFRTNKTWKSFEPYYRNFEKNFHKIMDDLDAHVAQQKKILYTQTPEQFKIFLNDMIFHILLSIIFWLIMCWFMSTYYPLLDNEGFLPPFHKIKFPKSHVFKRLHLPRKLGDYKFRYYKPFRFKIKIFP